MIWVMGKLCRFANKIYQNVLKVLCFFFPWLYNNIESRIELVDPQTDVIF